MVAFGVTLDTGLCADETVGDRDCSTLYVHDNQLTGTIPKTVATLKYLELINVTHNFFTGALRAVCVCVCVGVCASVRMTELDWLCVHVCVGVSVPVCVRFARWCARLHAAAGLLSRRCLASSCEPRSLTWSETARS